jgi:hypothetical protein
VKPIVHRGYQGQDLVLPDDPAAVIRPADVPYLRERIGDDGAAWKAVHTHSAGAADEGKPPGGGR